MKEFPLVYTNVWDGIIAVPLVLILVQVLKILFSIKGPYIPTLSTVIGLIISISLVILIAYQQEYLWVSFMEMGL
ncbi:hypothetical protein [Priestia endophytica]|jgi:hypothetical protein